MNIKEQAINLTDVVEVGMLHEYVVRHAVTGEPSLVCVRVGGHVFVAKADDQSRTKIRVYDNAANCDETSVVRIIATYISYDDELQEMIGIETTASKAVRLINEHDDIADVEPSRELKSALYLLVDRAMMADVGAPCRFDVPVDARFGAKHRGCNIVGAKLESLGCKPAGDDLFMLLMSSVGVYLKKIKAELVAEKTACGF